MCPVACISKQNHNLPTRFFVKQLNYITVNSSIKKLSLRWSVLERMYRGWDAADAVDEARAVEGVDGHDGGVA